MLKLKHRFHLPDLSFDSHPPLQLEPIPAFDDDDELTQAIAADPVDHDDNWTLDERPDQSQLESFWAEVTSDLKKDPGWGKFESEDA